MNKQTSAYPHLFIYDIGQKPSNHKYEYGSFDLNATKIIKSNIITDQDLWIENVKKSIKELNPKRSGIILYIHGFQGDNKYFVQSSGYILQKEVFANEAHPYGMTISLQWKSGFLYPDAEQTALQKGENIATVMDKIYKIQQKIHPGAPISVICHSMGNRVWQGLYEKWIDINKKIKIDIVFFFAADLECDIFNKSFSDIQNHIAHSYVFFNRIDRTLQMANAIKEYTRLGVYGTSPDTDINSKNITQQDVTDINDEETFAGKLSLHRYYYGSPTLRNKTIQILSGKSSD